MKNIPTFDTFINENKNEDLDLDSIILESLIEKEIENLIYDKDDINEFNNLISLIDELSSNFVNEDEMEDDIENAKNRGKRSTTKKVVNAIGWIAFPGVSLLRAVYKTIKKKSAIKRLISKETDPMKKEKLRAQLKKLSRQQVAEYEKLQQAKEKRGKKQEDAENNIDKIKKLDDKQREALVSKAEKEKEEAKKLRDEIEKEKESVKK